MVIAIMNTGIAILIAGLALAVSYGMANRYEMSPPKGGVVILDQFTGQVVACAPTNNCQMVREGSWLW